MPPKKNTANPPTDPVLDCAKRIVSLIRAGEIVLHKRIGESSLAETLHVPRVIVRSALEHLEIAGLVERVARSGTFLREISVTEYCDVMDIRAALETLGARLAAQHARDSDLKVMATLARQVDVLNQRLNAGEDEVVWELSQKDLDFHIKLAHLSGNVRLASSLQQHRLIEVTFAIAHHREPTRHSLRNHSVPSHLDIVKAIQSRDPSKAEKVLQEHILLTKEARLARISGSLSNDAYRRRAPIK